MFSALPYSMDSLIRNGASIDGFFKNTVVPLSLYGFGTVETILNLKKYEIDEMKGVLRDSDVSNMIMLMHGLVPKT